MKTYRNKELGFEIDLPDHWIRAPLPGEGLEDCIQFGCPDEAFNIIVGFLLPERLPDYTELEFSLHAERHGYHQLNFGRISVCGKEHVWASYHIRDWMGTRWNKKYMIVFGGLEYAITATSQDPEWFEKRESDWDVIVKSFRLMKWREHSIRSLKTFRRDTAGQLYEKAYNAVEAGRYSEAQMLLEKCLAENTEHVLARKELAVVMRKLGDVKGALGHRWEVKRLAPSDTLNRVNIMSLLDVLGNRVEALREIDELLELQPDNRQWKAFRAKLVDHPLGLTYPQHYKTVSKKHPGAARILRLQDSSVYHGKHGTKVRLVYRWDKALSYQEARRLALRTHAYIACAIFDASSAAELFCKAWTVPHGQRPTWRIADSRIPVSLTGGECTIKCVNEHLV